MHGTPEVAHLPSLGDIARRALPSLLEATIVPAVLFYAVLVQTGPTAAMVATMCWSLGVLGLHLRDGDRVPTLLLLSLGGIAVRTVAGVLSGSAVMYFLQPVLTTVVLAAVFAGSVVMGRPLVASLARDFCPLSPAVTDRAGVRRLFRQLTLLWAGVHLVTSALTVALLFSLPLATFVAVKTAACLAVTGAGVLATVAAALRTVRREGIVLATRRPAVVPDTAEAPALGLAA